MKSVSKSRVEDRVRYVLGFLLLFIAVNAFGGGYYGLAGAPDVPVALLHGSPFDNYFIPALVLFVVVGGSALVAGVMVLRKHPAAWKAAFLSATMMLIWITVQVSIIGFASWLQPATAVAAILILLFTTKLRNYGH